MGVDHSDGRQEWDRQLRRQKSVELHSSRPTGGGDSGHAGSGFGSTQVGDGAVASGIQSSAFGYGSEASGSSGSTAVGASAIATHDKAVAIGPGATAYEVEGCAFGYRAAAWGLRSVAIGGDAVANAQDSVVIGANVTGSTSWEILLGSAAHTVNVPGTFSNPSARCLKQNITPAPSMSGLFPQLSEYEYKAVPGVRRVGYIADDLVGSDAERFVTFNDDGQVSGIAYVDLHTAQIAALLERIERLEEELRGKNG